MKEQRSRKTLPLARSVIVAITLILSAMIAGNGGAGAPINVLAQNAAAPTVLIPYSGQLLNAENQPAPDSAYTFQFELYESANGGQPLWTEVQTQAPVHNGVFNTVLGMETPLALSLVETSARWLAVAVRGPDEAAFTELTPRQEFAAVQSAVTAAGSGDLTCPHDHVGEWWDVGVIDDLARSGFGVEGTVRGGINAAGVIHVRNLSTAGGSAVIAEHLGNGPGLYARSVDGQGTYTWSRNDVGVYASSNTTHGVYGKTTGDWSYASGVYGKAIHDHANGVTGWNDGGGVGVYAYSEQGKALFIRGRSDNLIEAWSIEPNDQRFRVTKDGAAYADGGWKGAADFAELISVEGSVADYTPGDVLVISDATDRSVALSAQPFSTAVIGVYSENPGFVGSAHPMEEALPDEVTVAMLGIVSCKVTAENGPIRRGDLLVTSSTPGHAMRAENPPSGAVLGKALEPWNSGAGVIQIAVTLQ
jgi:hypothetical protein